jgi:hypothetical protein
MEYWQDYLPVHPTPPHPVYPGVQLRIEGAANNLGGYLNIVDAHWVPWSMLTIWKENLPVNQAQFDESSIEIIFHALEWSTFDPPVTTQHYGTDSQRKIRRTETSISRLRRQIQNREAMENREIIEIPDSDEEVQNMTKLFRARTAIGPTKSAAEDVHFSYELDVLELPYRLEEVEESETHVVLLERINIVLATVAVLLMSAILAQLVV